MRLRHHAGEGAPALEIRWEHALAIRQRRVQVFGERGVSVLPGERADAGRAALRRRAEGTGHAQPGTREPVEVGRSDPGVAVDAKVAPAKIVGDEDHDIRLRRWGLCERGSGSGEGGRSQQGRRCQYPSHLPSRPSAGAPDVLASSYMPG